MVRPIDTYQLGKKCRGLVGVFNYVEFDDKTVNCRFGALEDSKNLMSVFEQMNYLVEPFTDLTKNDTFKQLDEISKRVNSDSLVLFFLSHGNGENNFHTKDIGGSINVHDIMYHFTNSKCPNMTGKPKILLFNYCRGETYQSNRIESDGASSNEQEVPQDMGIVHAAPPRIKALRSPDTGTIFVNSLCKVLCKSAQTKDLHDVVTETSQLMQKCDYNGTTASCTFYDMKKKFYFM